jgi:ABC-type transport system substrate-binding protein
MAIRARRHGMGRHRGIGRWRLGLLAVVPALVAGCLSFEEPTPSPAPRTPEPSPTASAPPRTADTLVVAVPGDPAGWLPPASDAASAFLVNVLYDPLYRLDPTLTPQPELAAGPPLVSGGGLSWSITLAGGDLRFADGTPLRASDVVFSLRLARSPACPLGRDLCDSVSRYLDELGEPSAERLTLTLREPYQPFLAEVLGRLPILSEVSVRAGAAAIIAAASGLNPRAPDAQVARIAEATNAEACLSEVPPFGCRLADHITDLESTLGSAGLAPPARAIWTDATGTFDEEAYAGALLDRVAALGQVLSGREIDQLAAALTLIDPVARPLGSGPFRLERVAPGEGLSLVANPYHVGGAPGIARIEVRIVRDPAAAATLLQTGDVDWLPSIAPDQVVGLDAAAGLHAAMRPLPLQRTIVFNTRPGRVYADAP